MLSASLAAFSAAMPAANGVDFFEPLKPLFPAEPHVIALPCMSEIVMRVLLNVAWMWATPSASTTRDFFFVLGPLAMPLLRRLEFGLAGPNYFFAAAFFLPGIARRGPFLVRAFVCVRWPWTGRPRRCRSPR